ncbi:hypothetical protein N182_21005 [Sinorhizobium sp. GL2]|nr:hypothetical protein N182_21005 [Sinorhizobium sp. GL2]
MRRCSNNQGVFRITRLYVRHSTTLMTSDENPTSFKRSTVQPGAFSTTSWRNATTPETALIDKSGIAWSRPTDELGCGRVGKHGQTGVIVEFVD